MEDLVDLLSQATSRTASSEFDPTEMALSILDIGDVHIQVAFPHSGLPQPVFR